MFLAYCLKNKKFLAEQAAPEQPLPAAQFR